jgi:lipopolysaccharide export system permease protein
VTLATQIDRYLARLILVPLLATLTLAAMLLILDKMLRLFDFVVSEGGPVGVVWRMLANLVPEYLALGIPIGLLLGTLFAFRKLALSSELDSLRAVGLGYTRLLRVPYIFAIILMALNVAIVGFVQPVARYGYEQLRFDLRSGALGASIKVGEFTNLGKRMTLRVEASEDKGRLLHGVFVRAETRDGRTIAVTADHGTFLATDDPDVIPASAVERAAGAQFPQIYGAARAELPDPGPSDRSAGGGAVPQPRARRRGRADATRAAPPTAPRRRRRRRRPATPVRANFHYRVTEIVMMLLMRCWRWRWRCAQAQHVGPRHLPLHRHGRHVHKINQYAEQMAPQGRLDAVIALWTPFFLFAALIAWMYWTLAYKPGGQPIGALERGVSKLAKGIGRILRLGGGGRREAVPAE